MAKGGVEVSTIQQLTLFLNLLRAQKKWAGQKETTVVLACVVNGWQQ